MKLYLVYRYWEWEIDELFYATLDKNKWEEMKKEYEQYEEDDFISYYFWETDLDTILYYKKPASESHLSSIEDMKWIGKWK